MYKTIILAALCLVGTSVMAADNGLARKKSHHSVTVTMDRLENILKKKGISVALRWKHSDKANEVGVKLRDTEILIFGNPKMGSPLMMSNQEIGIDLPMKALAYEDEKGQVWLVYNKASYLKKRHGIKDKNLVFEKMAGALDKMTTKAVSK